MSPKIEQYYALNPTSYRTMVQINLSQSISSDTDEMEQQLDLVLAKGADICGEQLRLVFKGVRNLRLEQSELSLMTFSHLEIKQRTSDFRIRNEDDLLSFSCRDFDTNKLAV